MGYDRQKVIDILLNEVGYLEKASNANLDSKTGNAGYANFTKYARDLDALGYFYNGPKQGYAYCDVTVDWSFVKAYGVEAALFLLCQPKYSAGAGCGYSAQYYKNKGQFHTKNPQPGDQIFFGSASNVTHTGLVYKVTSSKVYTIEGNTSGASGVIANGGGVCEKSYSLNYSKIYGYGRPAYNDDYTPTVTTSTAKISGNIDTVKEVQIWANNTFASGLNPDGLYGSLTKKALVKALQKTLGVSVDGIYGAKTNAAVKVLKKGSTGTLVKILQAFLVCNGFTSAYVDGDFGNCTYAALRSYQSKVGITVDGKAGQQTFTRLCT